MIRKYNKKILKFFKKSKPFEVAKAIFFIVLFIHSIYAATHVLFLQDQARDYLLTEKAIQTGNYAVPYGPKASVGNFYLPPFYYQLQLIVQMLLPNMPLAMQWVTVVVESLTPVLIFYLLKTYLKQQHAALLALLYSLFHLTLIYSSHSWNPNMIPFFSTALVTSMVYFNMTQRSRYLYFAVLSAAIAVHLHFQSAVLVPITGLFWLYVFIKSQYHRVHLIAAAALGILTFTSYFLAEITHHYPNTTAMYHFFTDQHSQYYDRVSKPAYILSYLPSFIERVMFSLETKALFIGRVLFFSGLMLAGILSLKNKAIRFLLVYFISVIISLRFFKGDKLDYYLMPLFIFPVYLLSMWFYFSKKVSYLLTVSCVLLIIINLPHLGYFNLYKELKKSSQDIEQQSPSKSVQLVFHDLYYQNYIYFGLQRFTDLTIAPSSTAVIDICNAGSGECEWSGKLFCHYGAKDNEDILWYAAQPKIGNNYKKLLARIYGNKYMVVIGQVDTPRELPRHPRQHDVTIYGSDSLL